MGDLFRIRWDFDGGEKGVHVNSEFFGGQGTIGTTKIAFRPTQQPLTPGSSTLYDQVINDQSNFLDYQTKPNTDSQEFTPEQRTGETTLSAQQNALRSMAKRLADKWDASGC